jgi:hypothetical protein
MEKFGRYWKEHIDRMIFDRIPEKIRRKRKFGKTSEMMEGVCFIIS